jgi:hypothetical protein
MAVGKITGKLWFRRRSLAKSKDPYRHSMSGEQKCCLGNVLKIAYFDVGRTNQSSFGCVGWSYVEGEGNDWLVFLFLVNGASPIYLTYL